ncbi:hypothetical protein E1B28_002877 [Marasmius oreades]|uniref:Uncharacterized protein n=1 Tax=Marasmius oreades TaxID=181124 RepID=A0A9P7UMF3_9AGAR|nr:uncharacterized protein E1B28_002877 [Marasmius oreades]KAG7086960.1 hypothetical protein E1B28_002877 [Marasmius oreades]
MYIFNGKLNWFRYAVNETITIVFPAGFALNDPVCAFFQWTQDDAGKKNVNTIQQGVISMVIAKPDYFQVSFQASGYYGFDIIVPGHLNTITATMWNPANERSNPMTCTRQYGDLARVPSTAVFTGKLNWFNYARNEMVSLVVPNGVSNGAPVGLYSQWSVDGAGVPKANHAVNSTFRNVTASANGEAKGTFDDGYYTYEATVLSGSQGAKIRMSNPSLEESTSDLNQTDFRGLGKKKARDTHQIYSL